LDPKHAPRYNPTVALRAGKSGEQLVTRDSDIRRVLLADLGQKYKNPEHDLIVEEFGCNAARADVAVINGSLHAFEIKSDSDSLERLPGQIEAYRGVFEYVTLICGRRLIERAERRYRAGGACKRPFTKVGGLCCGP
jgi:hypothetical protein